jgi:hypothetical protein
MDLFLPGRGFPRRRIAFGLFTVIMLIGLAAWIYAVKHKESPAASGAKPAMHMSGPGLPVSEDPQTQLPRFPLDESPADPLRSQDVVTVPSNTGPTNPPDLRHNISEGKGESYKLPAPVTQVHSLSEAESVMGKPVRGEIGVPRIITLPPEVNTGVGTVDVHSVNGPIGSAVNEIGAPPGVHPEEVGKSKTVPLTKDKKEP